MTNTDRQARRQAAYEVRSALFRAAWERARELAVELGRAVRELFVRALKEVRAALAPKASRLDVIRAASRPVKACEPIVDDLNDRFARRLAQGFEAQAVKLEGALADARAAGEPAHEIARLETAVSDMRRAAAKAAAQAGDPPPSSPVPPVTPAPAPAQKRETLTVDSALDAMTSVEQVVLAHAFDRFEPKRDADKVLGVSHAGLQILLGRLRTLGLIGRGHVLTDLGRAVRFQLQASPPRIVKAEIARAAKAAKPAPKPVESAWTIPGLEDGRVATSGVAFRQSETAIRCARAARAW